MGWWLAVDKKLEGEIRTKIAPLSDKVSPSTPPLNPLSKSEIHTVLLCSGVAGGVEG